MPDHQQHSISIKIQKNHISLAKQLLWTPIVSPASFHHHLRPLLHSPHPLLVFFHLFLVPFLVLYPELLINLHKNEVSIKAWMKAQEHTCLICLW